MRLEQRMAVMPSGKKTLRPRGTSEIPHQTNKARTVSHGPLFRACPLTQTADRLVVDRNHPFEGGKQKT